MRLFVEYQIPSDLLSYSGTNPRAAASVRIAAVKKHVVRPRTSGSMLCGCFVGVSRFAAMNAKPY